VAGGVGAGARRAQAAKVERIKAWIAVRILGDTRAATVLARYILAPCASSPSPTRTCIPTIS
jgi:hypothetical protein